MIDYKTISVPYALPDVELKKIGKEGWILGGVATNRTNTFTVHSYHFWRKK